MALARRYALAGSWDGHLGRLEKSNGFFVVFFRIKEGNFLKLFFFFEKQEPHL